MRGKRFFPGGVVAAGLLSAAVFAVPAVSASAQTHITLTTVNAGGASFTSWVCSSGLHNLGVAGSGDVVNAVNGCNGRLWLHRLGYGGGASYCINPNSDVEVPAAHQASLSITASANTARC